MKKIYNSPAIADMRVMPKTICFPGIVGSTGEISGNLAKDRDDFDEEEILNSLENEKTTSLW